MSDENRYWRWCRLIDESEAERLLKSGMGIENKTEYWKEKKYNEGSYKKEEALTMYIFRHEFGFAK